MAAILDLRFDLIDLLIWAACAVIVTVAIYFIAWVQARSVFGGRRARHIQQGNWRRK